jgi:hypothetical protein
MKFRVLLAATAALALAACSESKTADDAAKTAEAAPAAAAPSGDAAPAVAAAAPAAGTAPTKEFMVGNWGTDGDCAMAIGFKANGTMDGPFDGWKLEGNVLTMIGNPQTSTLSVVDDKTLSAKNSESGKTFKLTRC